MRRSTTVLILAAWGLLVLDMCLPWIPMSHPRPNLTPLATMSHDWRVGGLPFAVNFVGNIVAFMPLGALLPLARRGATRVWQVALACAVFSTAIEVTQYASGRRVGDVDDVILNTLGGLLGYAALRAFQRLRRGGSVVN